MWHAFRWSRSCSLRWKLRTNDGTCSKCRFSNVSVEPGKYRILNRLEERIKSGTLIEDLAQKKAAIKLSQIYNILQSYLTEQRNDRIPRGLYIYGEVGCGKSMLMDSLFSELSTDDKVYSSKCRRVHFHSFMADVHARIHSLKMSDLKAKGRNFHVDTTDESNPIIRVANDISKEIRVLCFDEFQVTDVADALILSQLFSVLFENGTVCVATSNRSPDDLYEGGINRGYFLPFIDILKRYCIIHPMENNTDYRTILAEGVESFFFVENNTKPSVRVNELFHRILDGRNATSKDVSTAFGRSVTLKNTDPNGLVCMVSFSELCQIELGASDYRAIADKFKIVIINNIPILTLRRHDDARRFITLIDELYESKCAIACSAAANIEKLFEGKHSSTIANDECESIELKPGEAFGIDVAQNTGKTIGELASVRELRFAFSRASSRLVEMCSKDWWIRQRVIQ